MAKSLLFIPDISGFTHFVQTTEVQHSEHVIAELLEVLIASNTQGMQLAEVEGDALFFYKNGQIPSQEKLLAQIETMYTAFYSHLKMMETNRICPCKACADAPNLKLKIVLHCGQLQFMTVQGNRKPFGEAVIQSHRLLKNSIDSENYALISESLANEIGLIASYQSKLFNFNSGEDIYDGRKISYLFSEVDVSILKLHGFEPPEIVIANRPPNFKIKKVFNYNGHELLELITNYRYRYLWVEGVDEFQFDQNEVTRNGTEHVCVINGKHYNFKTVVKEVPSEKLIYGELTTDLPVVEKLYNFYIIEPISENQCILEAEQYWVSRTFKQKFLMLLVGKRQLRKGLKSALDKLGNVLDSDEILQVQ